MSFNPKIQRLERICSYPQGTGQFDARLDRLEKRLRVQPEDAQYDRRIERLNAIIDEEFSPHSYSGDIVSFETLFKHKLTKAEVSLSPIQSGSGDPSPTNVRPISAHTGATLKIGAEYPTADETYPVTFPQTVYGGTFDFVSGKLVVTEAILDLGTLTWNKDENRTGNFYGNNISDTPNDGFAKMCSVYAVANTKNANTISNGELSSNNAYGGHRIFVKDEAKDSMSAVDFKTAMSGVQLVYELATPIEIDLDQIEVQTLIGTNNIWSDAGGVTIKFN